MNEFNRKQLDAQAAPLATISEIGGEFALIDRISRLLGSALPGVLGIGDDCAAVPLKLFGPEADKLLLTTDTLVEGRHFRSAFPEPNDLGWKLLAVSLSDIAAMGGHPKIALLSFQFPASTEVEWVEGLVRGAQSAATHFDCAIVGGNCSGAETCSLTSTVIGSTENPITRRGAEAGDDLWVSGTIGLAALGLSILDGRSPPDIADAEKAITTYCKPIPRIALGRYLAESKLAHAMIDISDGLLQDAAHLASASNVSLIFDLANVAMAVPPAQSDRALLERIVAGDDYELLFAAPPDARASLESYGNRQDASANSCSLTRIGSVRAEPRAQVLLRNQQGELSRAEDLLFAQGIRRRGYDHFS